MFNLDAIRSYLHTHCLILTPNNRLKNKLLFSWGKEQQGDKPWRAPNVHSINDWIAQQWQHQQELGSTDALRITASSLVRRQVWNGCLAASQDTNPLIHPRLLVDQLDQAYSYLKLWQVSPEQWQTEASEADFQRVSRWVTLFEQKLAALALITEEQKIELLVNSCSPLTSEALKVEPNKSVILLNFDTLSPAHQALLNKHFDSVEQVNSNQQPAQHIARVACADALEEMQAAAQWAKQHLSNDVNQTIAIIDPNLGRNRSRLERVLTRVFEPEHHLPNSPRFTMPFNFSAGTPLALCPVVLDALNTLAWHQPKTPEATNYWLNSPFLGADGDQDLRYWMMTQLLKQKFYDLNLKQLTRLFTAASDQAFFDELTAKPWLQGLENLAQWPASQSGKDWAHTILATLTAFNWPGPRELDSEEHQQVKQFLALLEQLAEADWLEKPLSRQEMLVWLKELASRQPFQPQTPESPLQILGTLESAGLAFDRIWVLGMDDSQWPPAPSPNPLLPATLQRALNMPHASAERELAFCESLTRNYSHAAQEVIFSHAARDADRDQTVSPLIEQFQQLPAPATKAPIFQPAAFEWLQTLSAPPVTTEELSRLRGGSGMLQKQSRCPLAAFMEVRLFARRPEPATPGLNALDRGNLLHQALFHFWQKKPNLAELDAAALDNQLDAAINTAINELNLPQQQRFLQNESERLRRLLTPWLHFEQQRPAFDVMALEQSHNFKLGLLPLNLRLDRIDSVNGQWLLIDYKSGTTDPKKWLGNRPEEPQLPLYAVALSDQQQPVAAIAFAELQQKQQRLQGIGNPSLCDGIKAPDARGIEQADWAALLNHWRHSLLNLADELINGVTPLTFSSPQSELYLSHLSPLLRQAEQESLEHYLTAARSKP